MTCVTACAAALATALAAPACRGCADREPDEMVSEAPTPTMASPAVDAALEDRALEPVLLSPRAREVLATGKTGTRRASPGAASDVAADVARRPSAERRRRASPLPRLVAPRPTATSNRLEGKRRELRERLIALQQELQHLEEIRVGLEVKLSTSSAAAAQRLELEQVREELVELLRVRQDLLEELARVP